MVTKNRIDAIRLKCKRAEQHIDELKVGIAAFRDRHPYEIGAKPHPIAAINHTTLYVKSLELPPPELSLIIGDAVHNIRCALDHLAWHLVEVGGGTPDKDTYFPICSDPGGAHKFASALGKGEIKKIAKGALKIIEQIQPYNTGDDTLQFIHDLDRHDKHRLLITTATGYSEWSVTTGSYDFRVPFDLGGVYTLKDGDHITNLPTPTYEKQPHQNYKLRVEVTFGDSEVLEGEPVLPTLQEFLAFTNGIVGFFESFLV